MSRYRRLFFVLLVLAVLTAVYWLLPIDGRVFVMVEEEPAAWPTVRFDQEARPGEQATVVIADTEPWVYIKLDVISDDGVAGGRFLRYQPNPLGGEWFFSIRVPETERYELAFYHDCDQGCVEWARTEINNTVNASRFPAESVPTKLGVVFANPSRDWHGRSVWAVELTYADLPEAAYWGIEDLAVRVQRLANQGHRVLLRVDYAQNQSLPPPDDPEALQRYLGTVRLLARDARFAGVYALIVGSGYNNPAINDTAVAPDWVARLFNGYGTAPTAVDNVLAIARAENPTLRVLVGPVQPWVAEQLSEQSFNLDAPWLNDFDALLGYLETAAASRAAAGVGLARPDGFAVQAFGHPSLVDNPILEPLTDLPLPEFDGAQGGFRVYRDWLAVVNSYPAFAGSPVYITASSTFDVFSDAVPAENYPAGWLPNAMRVIVEEPQVVALCWFVDLLPVDDQWNDFRLTAPQGAMRQAAVDFDNLLQGN